MSENESKLKKTQLFFYSSVNFPLAVVGLPLVLFIPPLYGELGLSLASMGFILMLARLSDVFTDPLIGLLSDKTKMKFFTEVVIPPDSTLIDRDVIGVELFKRDGVRLVDVIRGDASLRRNLQEVSLKVGDRVVLRTQIAELLSLQRDKNLKRVDQVSAVETTTVEALITPECKMVDGRLGNCG